MWKKFQRKIETKNKSSTSSDTNDIKQHTYQNKKNKTVRRGIIGRVEYLLVKVDNRETETDTHTQRERERERESCAVLWSEDEEFISVTVHITAAASAWFITPAIDG